MTIRGARTNSDERIIFVRVDQMYTGQVDRLLGREDNFAGRLEIRLDMVSHEERGSQARGQAHLKYVEGNDLEEGKVLRPTS